MIPGLETSCRLDNQMRLIIQRVNKAKVTKIDTNEVTGQIEGGLFALIGIKKGDGEKEAQVLAEKLSKLRILKDEEKKMNLSVSDAKKEVLVVSQFTLYADTEGGNRPSFLDAEEPARAKEIYEYFVKRLEELGVETKTGSFGDYMKIEVELDGPVTIILE